MTTHPSVMCRIPRCRSSRRLLKLHSYITQPRQLYDPSGCTTVLISSSSSPLFGLRHATMNSAGSQIIRKRNLIYADSAHLNLNGNWFRRQVTTPDYETNVIATAELGAVAILGFTGTLLQLHVPLCSLNHVYIGYGVEVYGIESPNTTHNSTYIIDGGVQTVYSSRPRNLKEDVNFFWSQSLVDGTHTLTITNFGDALWLDYFLIHGGSAVPPRTVDSSASTSTGGVVTAPVTQSSARPTLLSSTSRQPLPSSSPPLTSSTEPSSTTFSSSESAISSLDSAVRSTTESSTLQTTPIPTYGEFTCQSHRKKADLGAIC